MHEMGIVTRNDGPRFWVQVAGAEISCVLRGRLKKEYQRVSSLLVVGDRVRVNLLPDGTGTVEEVAPRRTELVRPGFRGMPHVMAANVDQLLIVQAARDPRFKRQLVERFLAIARRTGMEPLVVVNKTDLEPEETISGWVAPRPPAASSGTGAMRASPGVNSAGPQSECGPAYLFAPGGAG